MAIVGSTIAKAYQHETTDFPGRLRVFIEFDEGNIYELPSLSGSGLTAFEGDEFTPINELGVFDELQWIEGKKLEGVFLDTSNTVIVKVMQKMFWLEDELDQTTVVVDDCEHASQIFVLRPVSC